MVAVLSNLVFLYVSTNLIAVIVAFSASNQGYLFTASTWNRQITISKSPFSSSSRIQLHGSSTSVSLDRDTIKQELCNLLQSTPGNVPTPTDLTQQILSKVQTLEQVSENSDKDILQELSGNWELLWTTQDKSSLESQQTLSWINPLENQSYSNNPNTMQESKGRSNPILPRNIQDTLENLNILKSNTNENEGSLSKSSDTKPSIRSSQSINLTTKQIRNVVAFQFILPNILSQILSQLRGTLTVDISFEPSPVNPIQIDVEFKACRIRLVSQQEDKSNQFLDLNIPLGFIGPSGWLRTSYIDKDLRITRGHKGSVFILSRPNFSL